MLVGHLARLSCHTRSCPHPRAFGVGVSDTTRSGMFSSHRNVRGSTAPHPSGRRSPAMKRQVSGLETPHQRLTRLRSRVQETHLERRASLAEAFAFLVQPQQRYGAPHSLSRVQHSTSTVASESLQAASGGPGRGTVLKSQSRNNATKPPQHPQTDVLSPLTKLGQSFQVRGRHASTLCRSCPLISLPARQGARARR